MTTEDLQLPEDEEPPKSRHIAVTTTISVSATDWHLLNRLVDIATGLARARHENELWAEQLEAARANLDGTKQCRHLVSHSLWSKRKLLRDVVARIMADRRKAEVDPFEGLL